MNFFKNFSCLALFPFLVRKGLAKLKSPGISGNPSPSFFQIFLVGQRSRRRTLRLVVPKAGEGRLGQASRVCEGAIGSASKTRDRSANRAEQGKQKHNPIRRFSVPQRTGFCRLNRIFFYSIFRLLRRADWKSRYTFLLSLTRMRSCCTFAGVDRLIFWNRFR